jgi:hypothetical protein
MSSLPAWARQALAALLALVVGVGVTVAVIEGTDDEGRATRTITIGIGGPRPVTEVKVDTNATQEGRQEGTLQVPEDLARNALQSDVGDHDGSRSEQPPGVTPEQLDAGREQQEELAQRDDLPNVTPDAAPSQAGCSTSLVRNYSSRRGVKPRLFVVHYTVSANRAGTGDVDAIVGLFNTPSFAASSHYVIDREGNCRYIVRESDKAWTQAAANPFAISVEVINSGREGTLISGAGKAKLARVIADSTKRWSIPLQTGAVSGCTATRAGIIDHASLGPCGGGHVDVNPYRGELPGIITAAKALRGSASSGPNLGVLTQSERTAATCLLEERRVAERHGGWDKVDASHLRRAEGCKASLARANARMHAAPGGENARTANRAARHRVVHAIL